MLKIHKNALENYTKEAYPKLHKIVGDDGLIAITSHDKCAAEIVSQLKECDQITYVGYSNNLSNYPEKIASFVDCKNGKRFFVVNKELQPTT